MEFWSVGHGARSLEHFLALLRGARIETLVDIRRYPVSRRHPHFSVPALAPALRDASVEYVHLPGLGGRRSAAPSSPHAALEEPGFRAYADHVASEEFAGAYARLRALAAQKRTAFMCAETLWTQCHRRILADRLTVNGDQVMHLIKAGEDVRHALWDLARVTAAGALVYDRGALVLLPPE